MWSESGGATGLIADHSTLLIDDLMEGNRGYAQGPERALMSALLFDGVQAYMNFATSRGKPTKDRHREAFNWVHESSRDYVFSFDNVCEALGIDPNFLRYGLSNACNSVNEWKRGRRNF